jgi:hypothetical protein
VNVINCNTNGTKGIKINRLITKKMNKSEIISVRLTPEKKEALMQYAIQDDRTFSSLISKIVGDGYANRTSKMAGDEEEKLN